ncbi:hypothetical protein Pmar_PMAR026391 [Perkinsus marinus ATCC 50983]|uniref:Uncharacterized protein n=1 Tax=Perkinsus marinus (strain ATCC 50983 / TXsc) TaxID=423536 RepID=C5LEM1_PERM5|nr:hypothetical protein Pmar_PMAR026391 [Perkinsus marinus ATCC 50983]EER04839.1 hypothetical protein Pmar_PMAR026391 [Perkinsus marinus ATCC 50983]|eukprot:XP_002773023.1 hypothetical protein Pmar_PMAR026391 [Perkinsus marinus ATCC 50983]
MRAATSLLTWNKIGMDQLDSFLEGALLRMPKTFQGFTRAGKQMYRNRKFRHSQVIDRVLNIAERPEIASVPWSAIKRTPIDEDDTAQLGTSDPSESDSEGGSDFPY